MANRILVTGGAGFIGAALVRGLLERGDEVVVIDSGWAAAFTNLEGLDVELIEGDILDSSILDRSLGAVRAIVHLAARTSVPDSIADPQADFQTNVVGSLRLIEAARAHGIRRLVFASSNAVVAGHGSPLHERLVPSPVAPYGAAKAAVEAYLAAYGRAYGIEAVSLRFANAYGPWSAHKASVVPMFVRAVVAGQPLVVRGSGAQTRDFVYVDDIVGAISACLDADAGAVNGAIFQVGTGVETSILDLANTVLAAADARESRIVHEAASAGDVVRNYSDVTLIREALGWQPKVSLTNGISTTVDWYRERTS